MGQEAALQGFAKRLLHIGRWCVMVALAIELAGARQRKRFFSAQVFLNLLIDNAYLAIVAVGMNFVFLSGGIDLSVGSVLALSTMVLAELVEHQHWSAPSAIVAVPVMGTLFGAFMGWLIQRFRLQPFIVTLAGMFLAHYTEFGRTVYAIGGNEQSVLGIIQTLITFDGSLSSWWTRIVIGVLPFVFCLLQRVFEAKRI